MKNRLKLGLWVRLEAKPSKGDVLAHFLENALADVEREPGTLRWYAVRFSAVSFGIFDVNPDEAARDRHHHGPVAVGIGAIAADVLAAPPTIERHEIIVAKA